LRGCWKVLSSECGVLSDRICETPSIKPGEGARTIAAVIVDCAAAAIER
jgi:hypothetical protein